MCDIFFAALIVTLDTTSIALIGYKRRCPAGTSAPNIYATCDRSGFYARIRRWREMERERSMMITTIGGTTPQLSLTTPSSLSSDSGGATSTSISFESSSHQQKRRDRRND